MEHEKILIEFKEYMDRLQIWKKNHGIFINDIKKLENSMNKMYDEYTNILIDYRRTKKERYLEEVESGKSILQFGVSSKTDGILS